MCCIFNILIIVIFRLKDFYFRLFKLDMYGLCFYALFKKGEGIKMKALSWVKLSKINGLTLIELMVCLALMGILAAIAIPTYQNFIITNRISSVASELHAAFLFARSEAIKRGVPVGICRSINAHSNTPSCATQLSNPINNAGWGDGWLIYVDVDSDKKQTSADIIIRVREKLFKSKEQGSIIPNPNKNQVIFNITGQTYGNYMRFAINRPDNDSDIEHDKFVCMASGGRVRVDNSLCQGN